MPPLLALIKRSLRLDETGVGALTSLPVLLLGAGAIAGAAFVSRFGTRRTLFSGLVLTGVAGALRGLYPKTVPLFAFTLLMGLGIAVLQPALASVVREWLPRLTTLATATYGNGLLVGEALSASLTLPFVLPLAGGWRGALALWSGPVILSALLLGLTPDPSAPAEPTRQKRPAGSPAAPTLPRGKAKGPTKARGSLWLPDWRSRTTWQLGVLQGGGSTLYFVTNAFVPTYLHAVGRPGLVAVSLSALNVAQLPASAVALALSRRPGALRWSLVASGLAGALGLGLLLGPSVVGGAGLIGFSSALALLASLALPPLLAERDEVAKVAAGMFTLGYLAAFLLPLLGGVLWDTTGVAASAFLPAAAGTLAVAGLAAGSHRLQPEAGLRGS